RIVPLEALPEHDRSAIVVDLPLGPEAIQMAQEAPAERRGVERSRRLRRPRVVPGDPLEDPQRLVERRVLLLVPIKDMPLVRAQRPHATELAVRAFEVQRPLPSAFPQRPIVKREVALLEEE